MANAIVLASGSPRRLELLTTLGFEVEVRRPDVDETPRAGEGAEELVQRLAVDKCNAVPASPSEVVLAADTVVILDGEILGKPDDADHAYMMLSVLSGREHRVVSGFALRQGEHRRVGSVESTVRMRKLTKESITAYIATGEPFDKAGSYGVQGLGGALVEEVRGSYSNVVGLPLTEVLAELVTLG